jgi:hypothetical protein
LNFKPVYIIFIALSIVLRNLAVACHVSGNSFVLLLALLFDLFAGVSLIYVIYKIFFETNKEQKTQQIQRDITQEVKRPKRQKFDTTKKINLESCSKNDLLTIDGFDEEKAKRFIKDRKEGKIYYDIDTFVSDFGLQPHQMIEVQDRLIFPPKPKNKMGRRIEI